MHWKKLPHWKIWQFCSNQDLYFILKLLLLKPKSERMDKIRALALLGATILSDVNIDPGPNPIVQFSPRLLLTSWMAGCHTHRTLFQHKASLKAAVNGNRWPLPSPPEAHGEYGNSLGQLAGSLLPITWMCNALAQWTWMAVLEIDSFKKQPEPTLVHRLRPPG